jgi:hypothetical protein
MSDEPILQMKFDQMSDFKFKAAYKTYSELFNDSQETDDKRILNDSITKLFEDEISYKQFYNEINQYRDSPEKERRFHRTRIKGKRKWAHRRDQQEKDRLNRHKN